MTSRCFLVIIRFGEVIDLKKIFMVIAAAVLLGACSADINSAYVEDLKARGADKTEIEELIRYEKNNRHLPDGGYVDVTGRTVEDVARERGLTLKEYLDEYELPPDMPALVSETEANYTIPVRRMLDMYGMSFESFRQVFNMPDSVDENMTWGEAIGEAPLGEYVDMYVGKDSLEGFKRMYSLDDSVNESTKWKDVREQVDAVKKAQREKQTGQRDE